MKNCKECKIDDQSEKIKNAKNGFQNIGFEIDEKYYSIGKDRLEDVI